MPVDPRRYGPRIPVESFCTELSGTAYRHALVVDMSEDGLRIQRPIGGPRTRSLQLELEIPGVDEIGWAHAEVCFDEIWRMKDASRAVIRTSGLRLVSAAQRHRRILREYVNDSWRELRRETDMSDYLQDAACYLRG